MQVKHNFKLLAYITELRCCVAILVLLNENSSYRTYRLRFSLVDRFADSSLQFRMIFVGQTCCRCIYIDDFGERLRGIVKKCKHPCPALRRWSMFSSHTA